ncbi:MAG: efflux RND transporter periplasmic adaptor subunit [Comamonadaceae bacterium]|nr:efflux RND transporter periplasmic adaptor subunit [Comamonadaceae bacterium]
MLVAAAAALAAAGGWYAWRGGGEQQPEYRPVQVTRGDIDVTVLSVGVVQPRNRLEIKPPIPGRVEQVLVPEGRSVARGTVLAWMSSTERAALLDAARGKGPEEVKRWEELYRATPILAPIDGTVILRNVEPGPEFHQQRCRVRDVRPADRHRPGGRDRHRPGTAATGRRRSSSTPTRGSTCRRSRRPDRLRRQDRQQRHHLPGGRAAGEGAAVHAQRHDRERALPGRDPQGRAAGAERCAARSRRPGLSCCAPPAPRRARRSSSR